MNDEQVMRRKRRRFIIESDTDDDNQMMDLKDEEIKIGSISKSVKHEALEKVLATGEGLSKRIKKIDEIIANEKRNNKKEIQVQYKIYNSVCIPFVFKLFNAIDQ
jgi:hypothetical protein